MRHCAAMTSPAAASSEASLVRALGVRQLAASIVNVTVGAGIFVLPGVVAAQEVVQRLVTAVEPLAIVRFADRLLVPGR